MSNRLSASDRLEIHELIARYAWTLDTADVEGFVGCFTDDGEMIWDAFEEPDRWQGADKLRGFIQFLATRPNAAGRQHHIGNVMVDGEGDEAEAKSYVTVTFRRGEGPYPVTFAGYYHDQVVRQDGRWLFRQRWVRDWSGPVLKGFAGQTGEREPRTRPAELSRGS